MTGIYLVLCVAALAIIPLNAVGLVGEPDPLTGIFAVLLAAPWFWLAGPISGDSRIAWNRIVAGVCMALNAMILWTVCRWIEEALTQGKR